MNRFQNKKYRIELKSTSAKNKIRYTDRLYKYMNEYSYLIFGTKLTFLFDIDNRFPITITNQITGRKLVIEKTDRFCWKDKLKEWLKNE